MIVDFYEAFGNDAAEALDIPKEVLAELNKELPNNLTYFQNEHGSYIVVPKPECIDSPLCMTTNFDLDPDKDALLIDRLKSLPFEKWAAYLYRAQKSVAVKNIKIGNHEQLIALENTIGNPLADKPNQMSNARMYPKEFPSPTALCFECDTGEKAYIHFQQQAYDSLTEIKFSNVDFPALKIDLYLYFPLSESTDPNAKTSETKLISANYSVTPSNAHTVAEALVALHIFRGIFTGTVKIDGQQMTAHDGDSWFDSQRVEDAISFWSSAEKLEKKLGITFNPGADFPTEDVKFFHELDLCLNQNKHVVWRHPFDHFHVNGFHPTVEDFTMDKMIGKESLRFTFLEGPIPCTLLGASFDLFSSSEMTDLMLTNIEWDDDTKQSGELYITDAPGKTWELKRLYMTKKDADSLCEKQSGSDAQGQDSE